MTTNPAFDAFSVEMHRRVCAADPAAFENDPLGEVKRLARELAREWARQRPEQLAAVIEERARRRKFDSESARRANDARMRLHKPPGNGGRRSVALPESDFADSTGGAR